jgi:hypothetical protein
MFPIILPPGSWIEANGPEDCQGFGSKGESLGRITPRGTWPILRSGANPLEFSCESDDGDMPRAKITVFINGEVLL